ncbi:MAG TPA: DNA polymerase IV [Solirubrobacteraceae bacterium]
MHAPSEHPRRVIAHLDCDSFYASVELLRRPELRGQPLVVAGSGPRAVVTTASYEARRFGVHSAMAAAHARRLCPQAIFIAPDFTAYRAKSREVWALVQERLRCPMQHVSLDEAYADVTGVEKPLRALRELVTAVRESTGITISVGVGPSRLVAKTASDAEKPAGFVVLSREQACERFAGQPTRLLQGVGPRTQERLAEMGMRTVADLQGADEAELVVRFGARMGRWLKARAFFHDASPVESSVAAKSRSSEITFDADVDDLAALEDTVRRLAAEVCAGLQGKEIRGRTIGIKVRLDDWTNATRARTLEAFTNDTEQVTAVALELLRAYAPARPVRLIGVRVASFEDEVTPPPVARVDQLALEV